MPLRIERPTRSAEELEFISRLSLRTESTSVSPAPQSLARQVGRNVTTPSTAIVGTELPFLFVSSPLRDEGLPPPASNLCHDKTGPVQVSQQHAPFPTWREGAPGLDQPTVRTLVGYGKFAGNSSEKPSDRSWSDEHRQTQRLLDDVQRQQWEPSRQPSPKACL
jgi:hypothetical protein